MSFLKKTSVYLISNVINASIPFILLPILTRYLTAAEYGQVAIFQTIITGLVPIVAFNTLGAMARAYFDHDDESYLRNYNGACIVLLFFSLLMIGTLTLLFSSQLISFFGISIEWLVLAIVIAGINFLVQFRLNQWQIKEKAIHFGVLQIGQSFLLFVFSILFVAYSLKGAEGRVQAHLYSMLIVLAIVISLIIKDKLVSFTQVKKEMFIDAFSFGFPLIPHVVGIYLLSSIDRFFINAQLGSDKAGIYMVAMQLSMGLVIFFDAINKAFMPWLFKELNNSQYAERKKIVKMTYLYFLILILLGVLSFFIAPYVLHFIAGSGYHEGQEIIGWLCLGQIFLGMYLMVTNYIFYAKNTGWLSLLTIICGAFNVALLLILIKPYGILGVAISFTISMFIRFLGTWMLAYRTKLVPWF